MCLQTAFSGVIRQESRAFFVNKEIRQALGKGVLHTPLPCHETVGAYCIRPERYMRIGTAVLVLSRAGGKI